MNDPVWYPLVDRGDIQEAVVAEYPESEAGVRDGWDVEFALWFEVGFRGSGPEMVDDNALHLLRFLSANHSLTFRTGTDARGNIVT